MKNFLLLLISILLINTSHAQLSIYTDIQHRSFVFDDGFIRKVEYLPLIKTAVGRKAIGYLDNARNFKVYANGGSTKINDGFTQVIHATDNLIAYKNTNSLNVWENGKITQLSAMVGNYKVGDSIVLFFDQIQNQYDAYYQGEIYPIEDFLAASSSESVFSVDTTTDTKTISVSESIEAGQLPSVKASDNIAAYVNYASMFRIFYRGNIIDQESYQVKSFDVGRNIVGYVDINAQFKVFYKGNTKVLEEFPPEEYAVGDDVLAFVGNDQYFKIYYNDSIYTIGYIQPVFKVADNIVAYQDAGGYFRVFYKGNIYTLESYYPAEYAIAYNSVAYVNRANTLRQFVEGNIYDITSATVDKWQLNYDVIQYRFGQNLYKFFYKGQTY